MIGSDMLRRGEWRGVLSIYWVTSRSLHSNVALSLSIVLDHSLRLYFVLCVRLPYLCWAFLAFTLLRESFGSAAPVFDTLFRWGRKVSGVQWSVVTWWGWSGSHINQYSSSPIIFPSISPITSSLLAFLFHLRSMFLSFLTLSFLDFKIITLCLPFLYHCLCVYCLPFGSNSWTLQKSSAIIRKTFWYILIGFLLFLEE